VLSALLLIATRAAHAQTETVLYNFTGGSDGGGPQSRLALDGAGNFYGTTAQGGLFAGGTAYQLSPNGVGGYNETVIYNFCSAASCADGAYPFSELIIDSAGNLYGTTYSGGAPGCYNDTSCGVVFELSPSGGVSWTETVVYAFPSDGANGFGPVGGLIMDSSGNLYGTTSERVCFDCTGGAVFKLSPSSGSWTYQLLYAPGTTTGYGTYAGLTMDSAQNIFGVTYSTVFELSPDGKGNWNPTVIHTFTGRPKDGYNAGCTPVLDKAGNLYGTTQQGGTRGDGTVYKLTKGKETGTWTEKILYSFNGSPEDGATPVGIVLDATGDIYGTTFTGGPYGGMGTVFELVAPVGETGSYKENLLWYFNETDGQFPYDSVILDSAGNLYGTTNQGGSSGAGVVFKVALPAVNTTIALTSSPNPSTYGQAVTVTAAVTSSAGAPPDGETISFMKGTTVLGTGTLIGGTASFTTSTLPAAANVVQAVYGGDLKFGSSKSNTVKQVVSKATTTTALASSLNPSNVGQSVTFSASVTPEFSGKVTGTVTFYDGTTALKTIGVSGGVAKFTTSTLTSGTHSITAVYGGNSNFSGSTSGPVSQFVRVATTTTLTSSPNPSAYGQAVTFTATVISSVGAPPPDGETISFMKGTTVLGTGTLSGGTASFTTSMLPVGTNTINSVYGGDSNFPGSTSKAVKQVVSKATTTTALASSLNPSNVGQSVTFSASVTPEFSGKVTGTVTFYDGTTALKTIGVSGGTAKFTTATLTSGTHSITATYNGSGSFFGSSSAPLTQTVN
jgi:uncharacterized repeat protein (TIGR03803 family)